MDNCPLCALREYVRQLKEQNLAMRVRLKDVFEVTRDNPDAIQAATVACDIAAEALALVTKTPPNVVPE